MRAALPVLELERRLGHKLRRRYLPLLQLGRAWRILPGDAERILHGEGDGIADVLALGGDRETVAVRDLCLFLGVDRRTLQAAGCPFRPGLHRAPVKSVRRWLLKLRQPALWRGEPQHARAQIRFHVTDGVLAS